MRRFTLLTCILATFPAALRATTITYNDFSNTTGLTFVGVTSTPTTVDGTVLRLVPSAGYNTGAAYATTPITLGLNNSFSTQFQFRITNPGGINPADGLTFILAANPNGLGVTGGGFGYQGLNNSVAVEFDTYQNPTPADPNDNHAGVDINGDTDGNNASYPIVTGTPYGVGTCDFSGPTGTAYQSSGCFANGKLWTALITYNGSLLNVTVTDPSQSGSSHVIINDPIDIGSYLGTNTAYVGFSGATGSGFENEDIVNWRLSNTATLPSATPEPASLWMVLTGCAGMASTLRRRIKTRRVG